MTSLLERDRELAVLDSARERAARGTGALVLVEGAAGVGKSALMRETMTRARDHDALVLSASGGELEREFPFGVVRQLLEPELLGATPERRAALLSGAAAAAEPALGLNTDPGAPAPDVGFAVLHGLYWLIAALAEERPLLLAIDDAHWADAPSLRCLDFLVRRVEELPVLMVVGLRPGEPGAEHELLSTLADADAATIVRPALLSPEATGALAAERLGADQDSEGTDAAHRATGGNPLLLRELLRTVEEAGESLSARAVEDAVPSSVARSVERRLSRLPSATSDVAVALAVLGDRLDVQLLASVTGQDRSAVLDALDELREAGLAAGDPPGYTHPLLREAVADSVGTRERHRLQGLAARTLSETPGAADQVVVHLLAAPPIGEEWAAQALRDAGRRALAEGAPEAAVVRLRRAIEESGKDPELLLELGMAESSAGDPAATERLAEAERGGDVLVTARAAAAQMAISSLTASPDVALYAERLESALAQLPADADPDLVDELTGVLLISLARDPAHADRRREILDEFRDRARDSTLGVAAVEALNREGTAAEVRELALASLSSNPLRVPHKIPGGGQTATFCLASVDEPELSDQALRDAEETSRRVGSRFYGAITAATRGEWNLLYGTLSSAEDSALHACELLESIGVGMLGNVTRSTAGLALTLQGRLKEAAEVLAPLDPGEPGWHTALVNQSRAELALAEGRTEDALTDIETAAQRYADFGWRQFGRWNPRALHATILAAAGRRDEAREMAAEEVAFARRTGRLSAEASALTALGLAQDGAEALSTLQAAHEVAARSPVAMVRALAALEYGSALRRAGRRGDAREVLRTAGETAAEIGATLLGRRAADELAVAGGRRRDPFSTGLESLTPSERRVAEHAARGLTNREIAETLFVTQKTVEVHLGHTYGKLGIRSRNQLADAMG